MFRSMILILTLILFNFNLLCSTRIVNKKLIRRQIEPKFCHVIENFDCKCNFDRLSCTSEDDLSSSIKIIENEKEKYQSIELVIMAIKDISVNRQTFQSIKYLFKNPSDHMEFRIKFEKFTNLELSSSSLFNEIFPSEHSLKSHKHIALEIYNPDVQPKENKNLFQYLNVDSFELYSLYPFHGSFQDLFQNANIQYLRLSGGDIYSDLSQTFHGNIARLELAKQATSLSAQNFPIYPAHELIINAFYITEFNTEHPPNYENLRELKVHSTDRIPANAFIQFPHIQTLSISTDQDIDSQAFNGLNHLEKLIIKDTKTSWNLNLIDSIPTLKEFETNIDQLDENIQCQLLEKMIQGQFVIQVLPNQSKCTCILSYLDYVNGRSSCSADHCEHSSCSIIRMNYNQINQTFQIPSIILRADGTNAFQPRQPNIYKTSYRISKEDQDKLDKAIPINQRLIQQETFNDQQSQISDNHHSLDMNVNSQEINENQNQNENKNENDYIDDVWNESKITKSLDNSKEDIWNEKTNLPIDNQLNDHYLTSTLSIHDDESTTRRTTIFSDGNQENDNENLSDENNSNKENENFDKDSSTNQSESIENQNSIKFNKKEIDWLPIILVIASIVGLLLFAFIYLFIKKRRGTHNYSPTPTNETK